MNNNHRNRKEYILKSLNYIINMIKNSENKSFKIKGWVIGLLPLILTTARYFHYVNFKVFILIFPIYYLIILDAHYINEKQKYINLYEKARQSLIKNNNCYQLFDLKFNDKSIKIKEYFTNVIHNFASVTFYLFILVFVIVFIIVL